MADFMLTCCSTADLSHEYFEGRDIPVACFHYQIDGADYDDDLGQSMSFEEFYDRMAKGAMPTTSQVSVGEFEDLWRPFLTAGKDICHISLSSGLSGAYSSACTARDDLASEFPDRKVIVIDSLGASSGYGLLVDAAADMRDRGCGIDEVAAWVEDNKLKVHHWFFSTDLTSYYRGGRITKGAAIFGTILNICPMLNMDNYGHLIPRSKCRGEKAAIRTIVDRMEQHARDGLQYSGKCFISESACIDAARAVADDVEWRFKQLDGKVVINSVGTVIGSHTGPGTIALFFFGDERVD